MLSVHGRKPIRPAIEPIAKALNSAGIRPNTVTVVGTIAAIAVAVVLIPTGHLTAAAITMALFTLFDLLDGTMARLRGGGTKFGATLDASCDRITDGALFGAILWWLVYSDNAPQPLVVACLVTLVGSQVISYVKARAEAGNLKVNGGLVERAERLIIGLLGVGLEGLGVPYAIEVAIWVLAAGTVFTVIQRLWMVAKQDGANDFIAAPAGAVIASSADESA